jgi:hypothetical protein
MPGDHLGPDWLPHLTLLSPLEHLKPTEQWMFWRLAKKYLLQSEDWTPGAHREPARWTSPLHWRDLLGGQNGSAPKLRAAQEAARTLCRQGFFERVQVGRCFRYRMIRPEDWPHENGGLSSL